MCGEQRNRASRAARSSGSSPRVRGAGGRRRDRTRPFGIIPACAGSSIRPVARPPRRRDHPRVCGEQLLYSLPLTFLQGSSPRVRGAVVTVRGTRLHDGIIPACAGSRGKSPCCGSRSRDHPRVCGEQLVTLVGKVCPCGSSPRVRGAVPPWRGERRMGGSSPRVRGAVLGHELFVLRVGIIPACAGSRRSTASPSARRGDHPRVCGEQRAPPPGEHMRMGSSPRVRGAVDGRRCRALRLGIIPACAGSRH